LDAFACPETVTSAPVAETSPVESASARNDGGDITDDEFEQLLNALHGDGSPGATQPAEDASPAVNETEEVQGSSGSEDITDDEFEALLDQLHGKGQFSADAADSTVSAGSSDAEGGGSQAGMPSGQNDDLITDDEFEKLLDEL